MKFKRIGTKMLCTILPVIIIAMLFINGVSSFTGQEIISDQISNRMSAELSSNTNMMADYLNEVSTMATTISRVIGNSYQTTPWEIYEKMLAEVIADNDIVLGSGLWFEPYVYDPESQYMGPYVYKDGSSIVTTFDYSNADYDYFNQEYYTNVVNETKAVFTNPYYDETSGLIMSSCSMPIIADGKFIGCVTVDIELSSITDVVKNIKVGKGGTAMMVDAAGVYMAGVDESKISGAVAITADENSSLASAGSTIMENTDGTTSAKINNKSYSLYYSTLELTGWKLVIQIPDSEINAPILRLASKLFAMTIVAILLVAVIIILQVRSISSGITRVKTFAGSLAQGDFSVPPLDVKTKDELGNMGTSLNEMFGSNKSVIGTISSHAVEINSSSNSLQEAANTLSNQFAEIRTNMSDVNEAMMTTSAATEEVNASTEEVLSNVNLLAQETIHSASMAQEIRGRANDVGNSSRDSFNSATELSKRFEINLQQSIENAKVVSSIGELANVISGIAEEINLLSLNASIEAARAGDAGKGFAVVASEIGQLAGSTGETVNKIQETIHEVQIAFDKLSNDAKEMLDFLIHNVTPDYQNFVSVAEQYGQDAESIDENAMNISRMAETIKNIMQEVTDAIQSIAEATQETTDVSNNIMQSIEVVGAQVSDVADMSLQQQDIAENLNDVVKKFKI